MYWLIDVEIQTGTIICTHTYLHVYLLKSLSLSSPWTTLQRKQCASMRITYESKSCTHTHMYARHNDYGNPIICLYDYNQPATILSNQRLHLISFGLFPCFGPPLHANNSRVEKKQTHSRKWSSAIIHHHSPSLINHHWPSITMTINTHHQPSLTKGQQPLINLD